MMIEFFSQRGWDVAIRMIVLTYIKYICMSLCIYNAKVIAIVHMLGKINYVSKLLAK